MHEPFNTLISSGVLRLASVPDRSQQTVTLSGVGSPQFARAILGLRQIYAVFDDHCSANELLAWTPRVTQGHFTLTMSNRYFTASKGTAKQEVLNFPSALDPLNILRDAVPSGIYSRDNEVLYYDRRKIANERYVPNLPKVTHLTRVQFMETRTHRTHRIQTRPISGGTT